MSELPNFCFHTFAVTHLFIFNWGSRRGKRIVRAVQALFMPCIVIVSLSCNKMHMCVIFPPCVCNEMHMCVIFPPCVCNEMHKCVIFPPCVCNEMHVCVIFPHRVCFCLECRRGHEWGSQTSYQQPGWGWGSTGGAIERTTRYYQVHQWTVWFRAWFCVVPFCWKVSHPLSWEPALVYSWNLLPTQHFLLEKYWLG